MDNVRRTGAHFVAVAAASLAACTTADIDESDHRAFFADVRVRKTLDGTDDHSGPFAEAGWTSASGSAGEIDYRIETWNLGAGMEWPATEQLRVVVGGGLGWQVNGFDDASGVVHVGNGLGPYVTLEAGWLATPWLEPYVRAGGMLALNQLSYTEQLELGARLHLVQPAVFFIGWRATSYDLDDIDDLLTIDSVELDASGLVVGLEFWF